MTHKIWWHLNYHWPASMFDNLKVDLAWKHAEVGWVCSNVGRAIVYACETIQNPPPPLPWCQPDVRQIQGRQYYVQWHTHGNALVIILFPFRSTKVWSSWEMMWLSHMRRQTDLDDNSASCLCWCRQHPNCSWRHICIWAHKSLCVKRWHHWACHYYFPNKRKDRDRHKWKCW